MSEGSPESEPPRRLGPWEWLVIFVLFGFLAAAIAYAIHGWNRLGAVGIPAMGWVLLAGGIAFALLVGIGLMALLFYSNRKGRDI